LFLFYFHNCECFSCVNNAHYAIIRYKETVARAKVEEARKQKKGT
jgi:hypothetical protein